MNHGSCANGVSVKTSNGTMLVDSAELALTSWRRCRGLLGRPDLPAGRGILLFPCRAVHTCFMRFRLDLVFFSGDFQVVRIIKNAGPWRFFNGGRRASGVLEMSTGWFPWHLLGEEDRFMLSGLNGKPVRLNKSG